MVAVSIDSGAVEATDRLREVPREKWHDLMLARRQFMEIRLSHDCRCLVEFVNDAKLMFEALGFASIEHMIREGYGLEPDEIDVAVEWLRLNPPAEAVPMETAKQLGAAARAQEIDAKDQANPGRQGQRTDLLYNNNSDIQEVKGAPTGTSAAAFLRRLRKDRPDIHARVLAGELSPHAGMIEAGFRKKREQKKATALERIQKLWSKLDQAGRKAHLEWTLKHCAICGREGAVDGTWCDACCDEGAATEAGRAA
jgi:hypothetical protein